MRPCFSVEIDTRIRLCCCSIGVLVFTAISIAIGRAVRGNQRKELNECRRCIHDHGQGCIVRLFALPAFFVVFAHVRFVVLTSFCWVLLMFFVGFCLCLLFSEGTLLRRLACSRHHTTHHRRSTLASADDQCTMNINNDNGKKTTTINKFQLSTFALAHARIPRSHAVSLSILANAHSTHTHSLTRRTLPLLFASLQRHTHCRSAHTAHTLSLHPLRNSHVTSPASAVCITRRTFAIRFVSVCLHRESMIQLQLNVSCDNRCLMLCFCDSLSACA